LADSRAGGHVELRKGAQKEAVRTNERPKSREETPVVGYGIEEVLFATAFVDMRLFAPTSNAACGKGGSLQWIWCKEATAT
jgi:hypothetical protein